MRSLRDVSPAAPGAPGSAATTTGVVIPGAGTLAFDRDRATGALRAIRGGGRTYLTVDAGGVWRWHGICIVREERRPDGMTRHVQTDRDQWREHYRWVDDALTEVDGVVIRRDGQGRVVACLPGGEDAAPLQHRWLYGHDAHGMTSVTGPFGSRTIARTGDGRVHSLLEHGTRRTFAHDEHGVRRGPSRPLGDHVDEAGRCWASLDATGVPRHVYVWDGSRCLARIDGSVGAPLAAVFSLDPSATPVRVVTPEAAVRIPRDAYGEGLLVHAGVPGLFGGQVHGGLVHLPLRRLDPLTGSFCEPDPCDGREADPRRADGYEGPLPAEPAPRSAYEVCRCDPVGRADPTGGVSAGLIISDLTWSFQNNILSFFGIDWWFNLFASLLVAPINLFGGDIENDFFDSTGLSGSEGHGGFGVRRGGFINAITRGRAFTTQHIVWSPDHEYALLERGEVVDPGGRGELSHYGTILSLTPAAHPRVLLQSMRLDRRDWVTAGAVPGWSRHGGVGVPTAPGTLTPWFPTGGLHLDSPLTTTRHDTACSFTELGPAAVALGDLEERTYLTAPAPTALAAGARVVVDDGTAMAMAIVVAVIAGPALGSVQFQRVQLDVDLTTLGTENLVMTQVAATPASTQSHGAGAVADSLDVHGTAASYSANDLLRLVASGGEVTVARVARLEARVPLERPLPAGLPPSIAVTRAVVGAAATPVTGSGTTLDFGAAARPAPGSTGLVSGGGIDVAVRIEAHTGTSEVTLDVALPGPLTAAPSITFRPVTPGPVLGTRTGEVEPDPFVTYTPTVAGAAPDGGTGPVVVRLDAGASAHARVVPGPALHDVAVLDRPAAGTGPFSTERFPTIGTPIRPVTRTDVTGLVVPDPTPFAAAPAVFLTRVADDPPAAGAALLAGVNVAAGVVSVTPATPPPAGVEPGRPVLVGTRPAVIRTVRVTVTFDGAFDLAATGLRLVRLTATGHAYLGQVAAAAEVLAEPVIDIGGTRVDVPFPRFVTGDLVKVTDRAGANPSWHRVASDASGRLRLLDGPPLNPGDAILVRHVATVDPGHGGPFLGIDGTRTGTGATATAVFSVWSADALAATAAVGIIDGDVTHPTTVAAGAQPLEITFSEPFDAAGVTVAALTRLADRFVPTLTRDGGVLLLEGAPGDLGTAGGGSIVAVAYTPVGPVATGTIGPGTLLVPEREATEVDRSQSLTDHELTHTLQYAKWGPLWFNIFPMLAMELPAILTTDTELPEYSRFLAGTVAAGTGSGWDLTIDDTAGVAITVGSALQVVQGARRARVTVTAIAGNVFTVRAADSGMPPTGDVSVRKQQRESVFDTFYAIFDVLTHGGLVNLLAGSTWGGIFWLLGKGVYGLGRAIAGTGELYPAAVQAGGTTLTLSDAAHAERLRAQGRVVVRQGDDTVVRSMTRTGNVITLTEAVAFTGDVHVAMYDSHEPGSAFDWYDYHPATVDAANPFVVELDAGSSLSLAAEDRVVIRYRGNRPRRTDVLAVNGTTIELLDPITIVDGERSLRIAKVGASDPLGNADSSAMVEMGMGWMKWIFDPYGQIEYAAAPQQEWARWLLRVMRWLLGTQNFSLLPGGYLWWWRLIPLIVGPEHVTPIEQEASENSGDLYSPLGRVFGQRTDDGYARHRMVVGDVARYRYWPWSRRSSFVTPGRLDQPGVHYTSELRTLPNRVAGGGGGAAPNGQVMVGGTPDPGTYVAEPFTRRDPDPRAVPGGDPLGFDTAPLGNVPVSARVQRMMSAYVAFTRPGDHRVTTQNGIDEAQRAVDAFELERQKLFFDITADDVTVTVAGRAVDLSAPGTSDRVTMVPFQRAAVGVTPNGSRAYRVTVADPDDPALQTDGDLRLVGVAAVGPAVPVEVSRFYAVGDGTYGPGGLAFAGMHLSRDLHIPVRRFTVEVVDTLPLRSAPDPAAGALSPLAIDTDGFLLVPAPIARPPVVTSVSGAPPAAGAADVITRVDAPTAAAFLGTAGSAFRVRFPPGSPTGEVVITVTVGIGATTTDLTSTFVLG